MDALTTYERANTVELAAHKIEDTPAFTAMRMNAFDKPLLFNS